MDTNSFRKNKLGKVIGPSIPEKKKD